MVGHGSSDGPREVGHQLAFETVQGCDGVITQLEAIARYVFGQQTEAVPGTSSEKLATGKLQTPSESFAVTFLEFANLQDGIKLIAQLLDPVGGVVNGRQTHTGHPEIKFHTKHLANSVVI